MIEMTKQDLDQYTKDIQENEERKAKAMLFALQLMESDRLEDQAYKDYLTSTYLTQESK